MGYYIHYDSVPIKQEYPKKTRSIKALTICIFLLMSVALSLIPQVRMALICIVFPGISADGTKALEALAMEIGQGVPLEEALHSFCTQVIGFVNGQS